MSKDAQLSAAGAEIVGALNGFLAALREGGDLAKRFTVRTVELNLQPGVSTGADIKTIRASLGLSQPLFARFLGVSVKAVRAWERGERRPTAMARRFLDEIAIAPDHWRRRLGELIVTKKRPADAGGRKRSAREP
jgi:putative transcriptional regulator